ncbi:terminase small subunit [Clostridium sp.]|uniref:terminase small subunit n=1 Tax=Clostridium sp. TaxID=1506 RepID=UPI0039969CF7
MARARSPSREKAKELYINSNGSIKLVDIAKELNIKDSQVRKWKSQDKWDDELKGALPLKKGSVPFSIQKKKTKGESEVDSVIENTELTDKQRLFCIYYIKYFNATKAYKKAYGCDYITANTNGPRLLVNTCIKKEIQRLKQGKLNQIMLSEDDIFQRYMDIAFADITDFVEFGKKEIEVINDVGATETVEINYVDFIDHKEVDGTLISEVSKGKDGVKIKLQDKMKALQWLSDRMDLLPKETQIKLENEKVKLYGLNEETDNEGVKEFIRATTMSEEEIKKMFEGDEDGQEEETTS